MKKAKVTNQKDLSKFTPANNKKFSWERRMSMIKDTFPSVVDLDWKKAFDDDIGLFAEIMKDVIKIEASEPGKSGPKPLIGRDEGFTRLRQVYQEDFSMLPFHESFNILARDMSITTLSRKIGLPRTSIFRLMNNVKSPTPEEIKMVAKAFKKQPSYFADYRALVVASAVHDKLVKYPEASVKWFETMAGKA